MGMYVSSYSGIWRRNFMYLYMLEGMEGGARGEEVGGIQFNGWNKFFEVSPLLVASSRGRREKRISTQSGEECVFGTQQRI